ncbi:MAG: LCP family protein [Propionicimonas sp.]|uniref:LCP family protein n=1 Tax=Propionicimonas sp. TaxID=1955623 RepID=UPI001D20C20C|nr:LCP family protein [Propionicimonas sp.]MBU4187579.1 LCP family protein [Actinomycetota bacterium]MBU4206771.1 LCP family protein [Actinomycetota bacterium]MBU4251017.1 LCP family protein [Actinomycetota bacterium]MBU4364567.1 LCP family protein [Actinomycetota bacterium]MBU4410347.1 LCP family protein [Actinomycetota bacterium]
MSTAAAGTRVELPAPQVRSQGISLRRGLVLIGFSALIPGTAQLAAGNRTVGKWAVRVWAGIVALVLFVGLLSLPFRSFAIGLYANQITLTILQWGVLAYGLGWALLLLDAWRLADPRAMSRTGKLISGGLAVVLAVSGTGIAWGASGIFGAQKSLFGDIFGGGGNAQVQNGRFNVLLLGGDAGADRTGLRPDSITVASIDAETGRTVLFSLPRNLQRAPFPADSPLHKLYPNGYYCPQESLANQCMLNGVYTLATQHKKLFPGVKYPGVEATRSSIEEILGLKINYWAMIDLKGFEKLIDAVGGIRLDVGKRVPIGSLHGKKGVYGWIEVGKNQHMDGFHALWFARSREYSTDYERMIRQKCVMSAMLKQLDPATVLTKFQSLADAGKQVVATNLPADQIGTMLDLAMRGKALPMASVSFTPPTLKAAVKGDIPTVNPDFVLIRRLTAEAIAASEAKDKAGTQTQAAPGSTKPPGTTPTAGGSSKPTKTTKTSKTNTDNLDSICKVS